MSTTATPRVLSLSECAERLKMKRSNVAKFLARREVEPAFSKAQGYFWWEADIERVKSEREGDKQRMASDEKRRRAALKRGEVEVVVPPPELARLGAKQKLVLSHLLLRPLRPDDDATRLALRRLADRGLVEALQNDPRTFQLTAAGRAAALQV